MAPGAGVTWTVVFATANRPNRVTATSRVRRLLGGAILACAALVAISALIIKQHYVVDVVAGAALAVGAYGAFLSRYPRARISDTARRVAPYLALSVAVIVAAAVACSWLAHRIGVRP